MLKAHDWAYTGLRTETSSSVYNPGGTQSFVDASSKRDTVSVSSREGNRLAPTPFELRTAAVLGPQGVILDRGSASGGWFSQRVYEGFLALGTGPLPVPPMEFDESLYNAALSRLNDKVRGELDLAVSLAEAGATARMLRVCKSASTYAKHPRFRNLPAKGTNAYLEFTYGWKPLIQDIYGAATESLNVVQARLGDVYSASAKSKRECPPISVTFPVAGYLESTTDPSMDYSKHLCKISITLDLEGFDLARWTSFNPGAVVWERIPYSFVIDMVYDIGSYLRNCETAMIYGTRFKGGYVVRSIKQKGTHTFKYDYSAYQGSTLMERRLRGIGATRQTYHRRDVLSSYPLPNLPSLDCDLGSGQVLNLAALLAQRVFKVKR